MPLPQQDEFGGIIELVKAGFSKGLNAASAAR